VALITFPDGTQVYARALGSRAVGPVDFGLYAYGRGRRRPSCLGALTNRLTGRALHGGSWVSPWDAEWIHWPDFGVPADSESAARDIVATFRRAQRGETVEVACFGGQGRTGTILACMAVLAGVPSNDAVEWVRANYSHKAVERDVQLRWVEWFASRLNVRRDR
jgi:hypothetical protein